MIEQARAARRDSEAKRVVRVPLSPWRPELGGDADGVEPGDAPLASELAL